ncbi:isochorismate synthase [Aquibacillus koreensis]|uniref:Isochorismate synthase MenF n=1 Tax=Aquibacillus koreensis TaxID=279446 RepID=A0A9X4AJG9_9BACI|nr:isochorismate synthase [Aquibacillus koreensis]MCT2535852.1 isochorismate synthase [Aquibacillus koreensis]MDC3420308.1 isochorismate synthase [Aquibacillus koreensis]
MIQTEIKSLEDALHESILLAKHKQTAQMLSITDTIDKIDPITFFNHAKEMQGERVFWTSPFDQFYLVGVGEAFALSAHASLKRFEQIEQKWKQMLSEVIMFNPHQVAGTGPIAMGGFSFDPSKQRTALWKDFETSQFRIPAYLLTIEKGKYYLTINLVVCPEDHPQQLLYEIETNKQLLLNRTTPLANGPTIKTKHEIEPLKWKEMVSKATEEIKNGYADKIVLAREMQVTFERKTDVAPILDNLIKTQTNSYVFAFENSQSCFLGATPERLVRVHDQQLLSTCLAGTAPRGDTREEDEQIGLELLNDVKNREEHEFVVQMIHEAISSSCEDIQVPNQPVLYPLKNLQHLYTPVKAVLKREYTIIDIVKRLHPTPALGGLPREKSLAFIRENELLDRGWYGAPIGWFDPHQNGEFAVAIRSALINGKKASLFAGCGVVKESEPEAEYQETNIKFTPMLSVLGGAS